MRLRETKRGARVSRGRASGVDGRGRAVRDGECSCRGAKRVAARRDPEGASTGNAPGDGRQGCRLFVHGVRKTVRRRTCGRAMGTRAGASDEAGCERRETRRALRARRAWVRASLCAVRNRRANTVFLNATAFKRCESSARRDATSQRRVVRLDSQTDGTEFEFSAAPNAEPAPPRKREFRGTFSRGQRSTFPPGAASIDALLSPRVTEGRCSHGPARHARRVRAERQRHAAEEEEGEEGGRRPRAASSPGPTSRQGDGQRRDAVHRHGGVRSARRCLSSRRFPAARRPRPRPPPPPPDPRAALPSLAAPREPAEEGSMIDAHGSRRCASPPARVTSARSLPRSCPPAPPAVRPLSPRLLVYR